MSQNPNDEPANKWRPIEDLPQNWKSMSNPELLSLAKVWEEQHQQLKESTSVKEFNERLLREWSIETGIIERLYTIDRGITQMLIEQGLDAALIPHGATDKSASEVVRILKDHRDALEGIFEFVGNRQLLTTSYIRQLHQVITRSQSYIDGIDQFNNPIRHELHRGDWKKWPNNPTRPDGIVHEYCPPLDVPAEMDRLVAMYQQHISDGVTPEVNAAWLHHRFTQTHPFEDGNGRMARALATTVFLQAGWFPLVINRDQRGEYILALEDADAGDLAPLVNIFSRIAKRSFARALELSEDVLQDNKALPQVVSGVVDIYRLRRRSVEQAYQRAENVAQQLCTEIYDVLNEAASELRKQFSDTAVEHPPYVFIRQSNERNEHYYAQQIVHTAKELDYWANVTRQRFWVRLTIIDTLSQQKTHLVFSLHYLGKTNRGVMVSTGFVYFPESKSNSHREADDDDPMDIQFGETHRVCHEPFYFSYQDEVRLSELKTDLRKWLRDAIAVGLAEWVQRS